MKRLTRLTKQIALTSAIGLALLAQSASAADQFIPIPSYRVGPYAAGGSGFYGGAIDYFNLVNLKGGLNGVKLLWEECETEYNAARGVECYERQKTAHGGASLFEPLSTGIAYGVLDRVAVDKIPMTTLGYGRSDAANGKVFPWVFPLITSYWNQAAAMIAYLGEKAGGVDKLKGKKSFTCITIPPLVKNQSPYSRHWQKNMVLNSSKFRLRIRVMNNNRNGCKSARHNLIM